MNDFQREIYKTIDILTEQKLKGLGFDKTRQGRVVSVSDMSCIVQIDGEDYTCKLRRGIYVEPNDIVFVKFPQNSSVDKYVETILGGNETPENLVISAEKILQKLKTVDGHGSGLDADTLDGKHGSEYATKEDLNGIDVDISGETIVENINLSTAIIDDKNLSVDVNDAISKKHNHSNKGVLGAITQNKVDNWNTVSDKSNIGHKHTETDITDLDKYTKSETDMKLNTKADKVYVDNSLSNKVDKVAGKQLSTEDFTTIEKAKLTGIEDGAEKNKVNSVNGKVGDVVISKSDVNLGNVDDKSSATIRGEITNTNITNALGYTPENSSSKGIANGHAPLDSNIKVPLSMLPDVAKQQTYVVEAIADRDSLTGLIMGEKCYVTGTGDSYIWDGAKWVTLAKADWENVNLQWTNIVGKPQSSIADIDDATTKRHMHTNKNIIDTITQILIDRWNSAWTHISDSIKHITSNERSKWNTVDNKADSTYVDTELNKKVDKVTGKQLSTEDFTTAEKDKLTDIENGANKYILPNATTTRLGGIKVGANLSVTADGTLSAIDDDSKSTFIVKQELFTATDGQTLFNLTKGNYQPNTNTISVYLYGGKQPNISISEVSTSSFRIIEPLKAGNVVLVEYIELSSATPYPIHGNDHLTGGYDPIPKATTTSDGLMSKEDKGKLNDVETGANKYIHPSTHSIGMITETTDKKILTATERSKITEIDNKVDNSRVLTDVPLNAKFTDTIYTHPASHPYTMITGVPTKLSDFSKDINFDERYYTESEMDTKLYGKVDNSRVLTDVPIGAKFTDTIVDISGKADKSYVDSELGGKVDNSRVLTDVPINAKFTDTNTTYAEITTTEIDAGTASTLRTITARRVKYILDKVASMISSLTKSDVGLGNVDNTSDLNKPISTATQSALSEKVDKTQVLTDVPSGAKFTDTVYTHPSNHPASMIAESPSRRFVSDAEKLAWDNKWDYNETTIKAVKVSNSGDADTVNGKTVAENVPVGAKFTDTITSINNKTGAISKTDIVALGIPAQDTVYTHPTSHPASMITESVTRRFVSDTEKNSWNSKAEVSNIPTRVGQLQNDKNYVTQGELGEAGFGDMIKAVYDPNNNGIVDNAEKVNGFTVNTNVPANAKFTDTIYTHPTGTNPHGTTKSDIGLGSVSNYGVATKAEAETGASNAKYMTPLRVKEAISSSPIYHVGKTDTSDKNLLWINTNL